MNERKKIENRLQKKEQEINALEEKIKAARVYVQALRDILKMLDDELSEANPESILRPGSAVAETRLAILHKGAPLHINDILSILGKKVTRESKASLTSSLAAYVRRNDIFTRPAPNTFGLIELGHETVEDSTIEPPENFGGFGPPQSLDEEIPF